MHTVVSKNSSKVENTHIKQYLEPSLYETPPTEEVSLDTFELYSIDRLRLLRDIEMLKARGFEDKELYSQILKAEHRYFHEPLVNSAHFDSLDYSEGKPEKEKRNRKTAIEIEKEKIEKDCASHFILRLGFCRTEDLRRWFLTQETLLFKARLDYLENDQRTKFMKAHGFKFDPVTEEDKRAKKHKLTGLAGTNEKNFESTKFYKVPFLQALQLMAPRQIYLERGMAYIPITRLLHIITVRFRQNLSQALTEASQIFEKVVSDDGRIAPMLKNMANKFIGEDFASRQAGMQQADKLSSPEQVEEAAKTHFPLCMRNLHQGLQKEHKLKHWGRLQYTLFLKGNKQSDDCI
jgi:DNA primase large subunit